MELCDKYLYELINIDPTMNDFFLFDKFKDKKHIQPNIYSEDYYHRLHNLDKKYQNILEKKKKRTFYDKILLRDILHSIHMELDYEIYMYMPVNHNQNLLIDYVTECNGNGNYIFQTRNDYLDFMGRLKTLRPITKEIIQKMRIGIRTIDKITFDELTFFIILVYF